MNIALLFGLPTAVSVPHSTATPYFLHEHSRCLGSKNRKFPRLAHGSSAS